MRRRASVLLGALLLAPPAQAIAQTSDCRTIRALTNADRRDFADLRIVVGPGALILDAGSRRSDLAGPTECEVSSEHDNRDIDCRWRFFRQEQAVAFYEPLLARMRTCLPDGLEAAEISTRTEGWLVLRRHEALVTSEYTQTKVELSLVESTVRSDAGATPTTRYYVQLTVEYEQGD